MTYTPRKQWPNLRATESTWRIVIAEPYRTMVEKSRRQHPPALWSTRIALRRRRLRSRHGADFASLSSRSISCGTANTARGTFHATAQSTRPKRSFDFRKKVVSQKHHAREAPSASPCGQCARRSHRVRYGAKASLHHPLAAKLVRQHYTRGSFRWRSHLDSQRSPLIRRF